MSLTDEFWKSSDFALKGVNETRRTSTPHETIEKGTGIDFITYNANKKLPCLKYDMIFR